ncbi:recombinase family protein [Nocardia sp. NPDC050175]|uniref:recombinase family protein n=1 Tax=Nocardia sp. NPDC050175 TaxID=3364317 RepID=UPI0037A514F7
MQVDEKAFIYVRISKDKEGAGLGVERQRADCAKLAAELGWTVVKVYDDNDTSAYALRKPRKGFNEMCSALEEGVADRVLVWHTDRLVRRTPELESFIELCERRNVTVHTVKAGILDLSTATGQMMARVQGAIAQHEVARGIERMKSAKRQAAVDGRYRGGPRPFGYESDGVTLRESEANAVREGAAQLLRGTSLRQVTREWNEAGFRTSRGGLEFKSGQVRNVMLRKRNAGMIEHEGKILGEASWEPIFDRDTLTALESLLRDPARASGVTYERRWTGSNVYFCGKEGCGARMLTTGAQRGKESLPAYRCSRSSHLSRLVEPVDEYVESVVLERLSRPDAKIVLGSDMQVNVEALKKREAAVEARLDDLMTMFNADEITGPQFKSGTAEKRQELADVRAEIARAREQSVLANLILAGDDMKAAWNACSPDVRGKIVDALMTVTILPASRGRKIGGKYFDHRFIRIVWKDPSAA